MPVMFQVITINFANGTEYNFPANATPQLTQEMNLVEQINKLAVHRGGTKQWTSAVLTVTNRE